MSLWSLRRSGQHSLTARCWATTSALAAPGLQASSSAVLSSLKPAVARCSLSRMTSMPAEVCHTWLSQASKRILHPNRQGQDFQWQKQKLLGCASTGANKQACTSHTYKADIKHMHARQTQTDAHTNRCSEGDEWQGQTGRGEAGIMERVLQLLAKP